jgi:hypothetical protein
MAKKTKANSKTVTKPTKTSTHKSILAPSIAKKDITLSVFLSIFAFLLLLVQIN